MDIKATIKDALQPIPLMHGVGFSVMLCAVIVLLNVLGANSTFEALEEKLASDAVDVSRAKSHAQDDPGAASGHHGAIPHVEANAKSKNALTAAPLPGLYEDGPEGILPVIDDAGKTVFNTYKKPFVSTKKPLIVIAISDYGLSEKAAQNILKSLPSEVSLIMSPYVQAPTGSQKRARALGHEIWMGLPVENAQTLDPGPKGLLRDGGLKYNQDALKWALSRTSGYVGVAAFMDERLTQSTATLKTVFDEVFKRGLGYFEMNAKAGTAVEILAKRNKAHYIRSTHDMSKTSLKTLELTAEARGYAVGVVKPYPNNIRSIKTWISTLEGKGYTLAPLSAVVQ